MQMSDNIQPVLENMFREFRGSSRKVTMAQQIAAFFRERIRSGALVSGQKLLNEEKLAEQLGIGRSTLREAIKILLVEGLLVQKRGIGTYVMAPPPALMESGLEDLSSSTNLIASMGYQPGTKDLSYTVTLPPKDVAAALEISASEPVARLKRTRTANGIPFIESTEFIPLSVLPRASVFEEFEGGSLYEFFESRLGVELKAAAVEITAEPAGADTARVLGMEPGDPTIVLKQVHYDVEHRAVLYSVNYHHAKHVKFKVIRTKR